MCHRLKHSKRYYTAKMNNGGNKGFKTCGIGQREWTSLVYTNPASVIDYEIS